MDENRRLLGRIIEAAYIISKNSICDVFVDYSGHVDVISASYYPNGFAGEKCEHCGEFHRGTAIYIIQVEIANRENLESVLWKLQTLANDLGVELD